MFLVKRKNVWVGALFTTFCLGSIITTIVYVKAVASVVCFADHHQVVFSCHVVPVVAEG